MLSRNLMLLSRRINPKNGIGGVSIVPRNYLSDYERLKDFKRPTMDEISVPCGDWQTAHNNKQRKLNIQLIASAGIFFITWFVGYEQGMFFCNYYPPERPADRPDGGWNA